MSFIQKVMAGFRKFMAGRRGADELSLALLILGSTKLPKQLAGRFLDRQKEHDWACILARSVFYAAVFLLSVAYLVDASYNPFLYFRF